MGWSVCLECENTSFPTVWYKKNSPPGQTVRFRKCCSRATTYNWTFIKSQSVVSRGTDHSWLIFPFVIVGSNYDSVENLLWCLDYTLDCKSQSWRPVTSTTQTNSHQSNFLLWEIKQLSVVAADDWWSLHFMNVDWTAQYIWVNVNLVSKGIFLSAVCQIYYWLKAGCPEL